MRCSARYRLMGGGDRTLFSPFLSTSLPITGVSNPRTPDGDFIFAYAAKAYFNNATLFYVCNAFEHSTLVQSYLPLTSAGILRLHNLLTQTYPLPTARTCPPHLLPACVLVATSG